MLVKIPQLHAHWVADARVFFLLAVDVPSVQPGCNKLQGWLKFHGLFCLTHQLHMLHSYIPPNLQVKDSEFVWTPKLKKHILSLSK